MEIEMMKKAAEVGKKLDAANREIINKKKYLESDIRFNRDTAKSASELKYATRRAEALQKELDALV